MNKPVMRKMRWIVYCWVDDNFEPYFISKCREHSSAMWEDKKDLLAPQDHRYIKTLFISDDEGAVIRRLDELQYQYGLEAACQDGFGSLKNSLYITPNNLKEKSYSNAVPVDVYSETGKFVVSLGSVGEAVNMFNLPEGNAYRCLGGHISSTKGYILEHQGAPLREIPKKRRKRQRPVNGYSPEGTLKHFKTMSDAAEHISGERKRACSVYTSLSSPIHKKKQAYGWTFFDVDATPPFEEVQKLRKSLTKSSVSITT